MGATTESIIAAVHSGVMSSVGSSEIYVSGTLTEPIYTNANIDVLFTELIDTATFTTVGDGSGSCEVYNTTNPGWVAGAVVTTGNPTCSFNPTADLTVGDSYTLFLSSAIEGDATGRSYNNQDFTFSAVNALEDYTTYTEVDSGAILTVTASKIDANSIARNADDYVYKDFTANHFAGDFVLELESTMYTGADENTQCIAWALMNVVADVFGAVVTNSKSALYLNALPNTTVSGDLTKYSLTESVNGARLNSAFIAVSLDTKYYLRITRDESVDFGTLTLAVYSDSARTILVGSESITLRAKTDFRYLYGINSFNSGNALAMDIDVENLNIVSNG